MRIIFALLFTQFLCTVFAQNFETTGIHQEQSEHYKALGHSAEYYQNNNQPSQDVNFQKNTCQLEKYVFGWHPYWSNGLQVNYNWDLLSDMSYFSYEVDPNTGNAQTTHGFSTAQAVDDALSNGVRVNLCVTLFSNHATFLGNTTARQTLITNLINLIQNRGAHGVNIDFESMSSSVSADYTSFMIDLCNQMHAAIPNSQVSIALHAVDWSGFYDIAALEPYVDLFCVMGYDYYWTGSSNAGPNDPLYHFQNTYNYTLSKSTTYYLDQGVPKNKLILGLPYYGREWQVASHSLPATTVANGAATFYNTVKTNASGDYDLANRNYEPESRSVYYNFYSGGNPYQCFISEEDELGERMDFINKRGLAGMGIWALGYDDGYIELWDEIENHFTNCASDPCSGEITDIGGGPLKNYYDNENYTFTLSPENATAIELEFTAFDTELGFDYLYIYDGSDETAPQIPGSPFSGTTLPANFTSSTGDLTFKFISDGATIASGFRADYNCILDATAPITSIDPVNDWQTDDFNVGFNDVDEVGGSGISKMYYHAGHYDGSQWRANQQRGFFNDNFVGTSLHSDWTIETGAWLQNNTLEQTDELQGNTNIYAPLNQSLSNQHVYHWKGQLGGSGTNRRAGLHIFCDDPTLPNRGNSYFVWYRLDDDLVQFYKVENDAFGTPVVNESFDFNPNTWYDFKLIYDRISGNVWIYVDDELIAQWQDSAPYETGEYISFRSGNAHYKVDSLKVYRSRYPSVIVSVGSDPTDDIQYQNTSPADPSGIISSIVKDQANNLSTVSDEWVDVDWTLPVIDFINDGNGTDEDTIDIMNVTIVPSNWSGEDPHSDIVEFEYAIGTTPFGQELEPWASNGTNENVNASSNFIINEWYHFSVRATNGAGLVDSLTSDGFRVISTANLNEESISIPVLFPNPAVNELNIKSNVAIKSVEVYDHMGRKLLEHNTSNKLIYSLDINDFASGNYTIRIIDENKVVDMKWFKR